MPEHNGDYSAEAEARRKAKREKVQRARMRERIRDGRATENEKRAIQVWESGNFGWDEIAQALAEAHAEIQAQGGGPARPARPARARVEEEEEEEEEVEGKPWGKKEWSIAGGVLAAFVAFVVWGVKSAG